MPNLTSLFDPGKASGAILNQVIAAIIVIVVVVVLGWVFGPFKWWWTNRKIRKMVHRRRFNFVFNPATPSQQRKVMTFLPTGQIGDGHNNNENSWRSKRGRLEIFGADGVLYSRFRFDAETGRLVSTNDPDIRSIRGQYFEIIGQRAVPPVNWCRVHCCG